MSSVDYWHHFPLVIGRYYQDCYCWVMAGDRVSGLSTGLPRGMPRRLVTLAYGFDLQRVAIFGVKLFRKPRLAAEITRYSSPLRQPSLLSLQSRAVSPRSAFLASRFLPARPSATVLQSAVTLADPPLVANSTVLFQSCYFPLRL